jgi:hypothetical protein
MNIRLEITINSDELEVINLVIKLLKTKVFKVTIFSGGFAITSYDGTWPNDLKTSISTVYDNLTVDLIDGLKPPGFKRVVIDGFPRLFD